MIEGQSKRLTSVRTAPKMRVSSYPEYLGSGKLKDKVALITEGSSDIGRSVAMLLAREGANVALTHLWEERADAIAAQAAIRREGHQVILIEGDITDPGFCEYAIEYTLDEYEQLDVLVNNASYKQQQHNIEDLSFEQWANTFKPNVYGYFCITKHAIPHLKKGASIIYTSSITGIHGKVALLDYATVNGAIHAFTKSLAQHLLPKGIRVNCITLGSTWMLSNLSNNSTENKLQLKNTPLMDRPAKLEEIAPAFVFFASEIDSRHVTGQVLSLLEEEIAK